jgi:hypothetical protein
VARAGASGIAAIGLFATADEVTLGPWCRDYAGVRRPALAVNRQSSIANLNRQSQSAIFNLQSSIVIVNLQSSMQSTIANRQSTIVNRQSAVQSAIHLLQSAMY